MALDFPATAKASRVRMVEEAQENRQSELELIQQSEPNSTPSAHVFQTQVLATFSTLARVLGARAILLMATVGAFVLAYLAMSSPSQMTLATTAIYDALVLLPLVYLTAMRN